MERNDAVIISEAVALAVGAEMVSAPADGRSPEYSLNDQGKIAGKGLLTFVNAAIGDPNPDELVCGILRDLAEQLSVGLDEEFEDEPDVQKRIAAWANQLKLAAKVHRTRKRRRHYCVVNPPRSSALRTRLDELLTRVRREVPDVIFFELHRKAKTKEAEEIVMQILKDRFRDGGQQ